MARRERQCDAGGVPEHHHLYLLVSLQIGDIQSYRSELFLFMPCDNASLVFLVDNGPWSVSKSLGLRPTEFWPFVVAKSRVSPFANQRLSSRSDKLEMGGSGGDSINVGLKHLHLYNWDSIYGIIRRHYKSLVHSGILCPQFHGCVGFEVSWADVRGMNYTNELQTDTCLSLEVKQMRKREFDCLEHALDFYGSHCGLGSKQSGKRGRCQADIFVDADRCKRQCVDEDGVDRYAADGGFFSPVRQVWPPESESTVTDAEKDIMDLTLETDLPCSPYSPSDESTQSPVFCSRRKLRSSRDEATKHSPEVPVAHIYKDALVVFRFSDPLLPFELRDIITSDQRLLKMLESGLFPWVIFMQSYPVFCNIYRPWMRPLARTIYFLISVVTVMIGFYDLYKNVPVLKATASHMLGPLFEWIESWEMVSRLKYLGTMLVLQNYEKAFAWVFLIVKSVRQLASLVMKPVMEPLQLLWSFFLPFWATFVQGTQSLQLVLESFFASTLCAVSYALSFVTWPFWVLLTTVTNLVSSIMGPVLPAFRVVLVLGDYARQYAAAIWTSFSQELLNLLKQSWTATSQSFQLWTASSAVQTSRTPSMWRILWDDLFSKVFRAVRYILNGLVAFFTALNRHRLSIYNNIVAFLVRLIVVVESGRRLLTDTWQRFHPNSSSAKSKSKAITTGSGSSSSLGSSSTPSNQANQGRLT
ncbi:hypothetical protein SELMODRAFT_419929 [Selaginella moellendorffii]|uniref:Uncharacterized protein n=1 Tax=Selaginella moellendorffii TaxID=88036 RepID=D8SA13_SELML|nr:hypothetical protein SELMODRAFT_419929 [Selaginella moellendorffii]